MMQKIEINVVFNIAEPLHGEIINISLEIKRKYKSEYWLDDKRYFLHFPMYLFAAPAENRAKILGAANKYLSLIKPTEIMAESMRFSKSGLVMVDFRLTETLYHYHEECLKIFNPLRDGLLRDKYENKEYFEAFTADEQKHLLDYGHIYVLDRFQPHTTIAQIKDLVICQEIIGKYSSRLIGKKSFISSLQIHESIFAPEDKTEVIYNKLLVDD